MATRIKTKDLEEMDDNELQWVRWFRGMVAAEEVLTETNFTDRMGWFYKAIAEAFAQRKHVENLIYRLEALERAWSGIAADVKRSVPTMVRRELVDSGVVTVNRAARKPRAKRS